MIRSLANVFLVFIFFYFFFWTNDRIDNVHNQMIKRERCLNCVLWIIKMNHQQYQLSSERLMGHPLCIVNGLNEIFDNALQILMSFSIRFLRAKQQIECLKLTHTPVKFCSFNISNHTIEYIYSPKLNSLESFTEKTTTNIFFFAHQITNNIQCPHFFPVCFFLDQNLY